MGGAMSRNEKTDNQAVSHINKAHMWRMAFFGLVILVAGAVIGGSTMLIFAPKKLTKPPRAPEFASVRMVGQLHRELRLTPEQTEKIKPVLKEHMQTLNDIRIDAQDQIGEALEQMNEQISSLLTDRQKQMWQKRLRHLQNPLRGGGGPGWGEGPGGGRFRGGQQERSRRGPGPGGPGPFGPRRRPAGPNTPQDGMNPGPEGPFEEPPR
jgi:Spy/CpxP family protein refolding chaperone